MLVPLLLWMEHLGAKIFFLGGISKEILGRSSLIFWDRIMMISIDLGENHGTLFGFLLIYIYIYNTLNDHFLIRKWWTFDRFWTLRISIFQDFSGSLRWTTSRRDTRYTYCIIFPGIALTAFYFIDFSLKIWTALLSFSILFFLWQRYVMLWLYGKSQFDSDACWTKLGSVKSCKLLFLLQSCWSLGAPERLCWGWLIWDKRCHDWSSSCQV